jgi:nucleotide-binding universal stress UspA family protein
MKENPTILAAADRSQQASHVILYGVDLAVRLRADLHVLYVEALHGEPFDRQVEARRERLVEEQMRAARAQKLPVHYATERDVTPAPGIIRYATEHKVDLIVMGTHGRRGVRALVLGSVANEVIRFAPCPVFTVSGADGEMLDISMISRVLVPIDFSRHAIGALMYARNLADMLKASLEIIHVVEDTFHPAFYGPFHHSIYDVNPDIEEIAERNIERLLQLTGGRPKDVTIDVFKGHPGRDIAAWAESHGSELIVMATHGLTGMQHLFMGSVTERTVRLAPCPVLTIHIDLLPHVEDELMEELNMSVV